ncbi:MAG: class I SAM-dependent methyltransferase [Cyclobacteriaceae bacterium]|nr:class I SAM-dependent methyltransferase [Cyclobacteriaceae bacterium]
MTLEPVTTCPVCQSVLFNNYLTATDHTVSKQLFHLVTCAQCGLGITTPRPNQQHIGEYYKSDNYISHTGGKRNLQDWLYRVARYFTLRWKRGLIERMVPKKNLLDYGCGTGAFINYMHNKGWETTGVEPSDEARQIASKNNKVVNTLSAIESTFECITLWHVLEHVHQLNETMRELKSRLAPSGTIFIAVPNMLSFDAHHYQKDWAAYDVPRHLWHFTKNSMHVLLQQNGFKLTATYPMKLDAFYISLLSETYRHTGRNPISRGLNALKIGLTSNRRASTSGEYSSIIYTATHA